MAIPTEESIPENITQELYKRNVELAVKNKTLSLLGKLYEISILTLEPVSLAERITQTIQTELEFDLVGIFSYEGKNDELTPLHFAKSKRLEEVLGETNKVFNDFAVSKASEHAVLKIIFSGSGMSHTENLTDIWNDLIPDNIVQTIKGEAHVRTLLFYPLTIGDKNVLGMLVIGLNRAYENLSEFEQEAIHNFVNVIATAYDKALLYQELEITNSKLEDANINLKRLDAAKSEFISLASHQLRAPLTVIKGYLSLALEGTLGPITDFVKESLGKAAFSTEQLVKLVNELLDLSRIESGKIQYQFAANDLVKIMDEVADELRPQAEAKEIALTVEAERGLPQFMFDRDKVREIVINLIHNAIKYTPKGEIVVRAEVIAKSTGNVVRLSIKDNGMGLAKEEISKLFTKFGRAEGARIIDPNGMGLGLFFVKKVAEDHGGTAWAESEGPGKGSVFIVELPTSFRMT